jgi:hypothetical protein
MQDKKESMIQDWRAEAKLWQASGKGGVSQPVDFVPSLLLPCRLMVDIITVQMKNLGFPFTTTGCST